MTTPQNPAERPDQAFNSEINTGMSAPPTRIENRIPHSSDASNVPVASATRAEPDAATRPKPSAKAIASPAARTPRWPRIASGACRTSPASFPLATMLPLNVTAPTRRANTPATSPIPLRADPRDSSTKETRHDANPPAPF